MALLFGVAQEIMGRLARATDSMQFSRTDFVCSLTLDEQEVVRLAGPQFIVNTSQSPNYPGPWYQRGFLSIWNRRGSPACEAHRASTASPATHRSQTKSLFEQHLRTRSNRA